MRVRLLRSASALVVLAVTAASLTAIAQRQQEFPHEAHAGLFPLCEGCHQGVPEGDRANFYPPPAQCAGCHDGVEQPRVDWEGPTEEPDNVVFEHPEHPDVDEQGSVIECTTCHTAAGAPRMAVAETPVVPQCLNCHEHRAEDHYIDADCSSCHMPLAEAPFDRVHLLALPEPPDHDSQDFLAEAHGHLAEVDITRCAVCHTRERCESCHVDAQVVTTIQRVPPAQGTVAAALPAYDAQYPLPPSHLRPNFLQNHGTNASAASCSTCHTREDCTTCHLPPGEPRVLADLTSRGETRAPGVQTLRRAPVSHDAPLFEIEHGNEAAVNGASCSACHTRTMCADCHNAAAAGDVSAAGHVVAGAVRRRSQQEQRDRQEQRDGQEQRNVQEQRNRQEQRSDIGRRNEPGTFHPANFLARHSAEAYGRRLECSNCHDNRLFCADCHASAGMSPGSTRGRLGPGFHDAEPLWLLRHGQAARQGLESCTSCHTQNECMQCHSVLGAFKVSPHGPNFDARRAQKRNAAVCLICHITDPLSGRT